MEKSEVYDYLAQIYFDKKKKKNKKAFYQKPVVLFLITITAIAPLFYLSLRYSVKLISPKRYSLYLATGGNLIKINYDFTNNSTIRQEGYTLALENLNAEDFQSLHFNARRLNKGGPLHLKVEIENEFKERAFTYLSAINDTWKTFSINLDAFKGISHWNNLRRISFVAEEWNTENKKDVLYIEDISFQKAG